MLESLKDILSLQTHSREYSEKGIIENGLSAGNYLGKKCGRIVCLGDSPTLHELGAEGFYSDLMSEPWVSA